LTVAADHRKTVVPVVPVVARGQPSGNLRVYASALWYTGQARAVPVVPSSTLAVMTGTIGTTWHQAWYREGPDPE
jgi:hypothetical protein